MAPTGFAYVPDACVAGGCDLHIAFHGCRQTAALVGNAFHSGVGYNRWADTNRVIVLYPQATATPANPNGCWDWWGYDDPRYATKSGRQMAAVRAMLARLAGDTEAPDPFCQVDSATNVGHWQAGRARITGLGEISVIDSRWELRQRNENQLAIEVLDQKGWSAQRAVTAPGSSGAEWGG